MLVLIVEDDRNKAERVQKHVDSVCGKYSEEYRSELRASYNSGLRACVELKPDLLILDMTMPTFDLAPSEAGGRPRDFAGKDILWELDRNGLRIPAIVVTGFPFFGEGPEQQNRDELTKDLAKCFPECFKGTVFYKTADVAWKKHLSQLIESTFGQDGE